MNYCGVAFIVVESAGSSPWKWKIFISDMDKMKTGGHAASRAAAIKLAHEAIGEGLRANASSGPDVQLPYQIHDVLDILHGARSLPAAEAVAALRPLLDSMHGRIAENDRIAAASVTAVHALVKKLEAKGFATDDLWEVAIESSVSFANATSFPEAAPSAYNADEGS